MIFFSFKFFHFLVVIYEDDIQVWPNGQTLWIDFVCMIAFYISERLEGIIQRITNSPSASLWCITSSVSRKLLVQFFFISIDHFYSGEVRVISIHDMGAQGFWPINCLQQSSATFPHFEAGLEIYEGWLS